jgi:hypothetical protein
MTKLSDAILEEGREDVVRAIVEGAKKLDPACVQVCAKHYQLPRKGRRVAMPIPKVRVAADLPLALNFIAEQVSVGLISAEEASDYVTLVNAQCRAIEVADIDIRLRALESETKENPQ